MALFEHYVENVKENHNLFQKMLQHTKFFNEAIRQISIWKKQVIMYPVQDLGAHGANQIYLIIFHHVTFPVIRTKAPWDDPQQRDSH